MKDMSGEFNRIVPGRIAVPGNNVVSSYKSMLVSDYLFGHAGACGSVLGYRLHRSVFVNVSVRVFGGFEFRPSFFGYPSQLAD